MKEDAITWGGLGIDSVSICQEVSRGHSTSGIEPQQAEVSQGGRTEHNLSGNTERSKSFRYWVTESQENM